MYKVEKTFDVLQGTVPDFRKTKAYTEELLHGADPVLDEKGELVPVKIGDNGEVTKADVTQEWYSYANKEWANAVILTDTGKNKEIEAGDTISETDIESYFVWIPKYRYKLFDMGNYQRPAMANEENKGATTVIEIEFGLTDTIDDESREEYKQCKTPMNEEGTQGLSGQSGKCQKDYWMTHPAFISFKANGLWVGKFSTSYKGARSANEAVKLETNISKIQIKPNMYIWRGIITKDAYQNSFNYKRDLDSHMMKNTEWGAVAYLTQSNYGRCDKEIKACTEITINSTSNYISGYTENTNYFSGSIGASTTGNYSGIYDMSGPAGTRTMGIMKNTNGNLMFGGSQLTSSILNNLKYYDAYEYSSNDMNWNRRILGDATGEIGPFNNEKISSMWGDIGTYCNSSVPLIARGGAFGYDSKAGVFTFVQNGGDYNSGATFRIVLTSRLLQ